MTFEFTITNKELKDMLKVSGKNKRNLRMRVSVTNIADKIEVQLQTSKDKWLDITDYESW